MDKIKSRFVNAILAQALKVYKDRAMKEFQTGFDRLQKRGVFVPSSMIQHNYTGGLFVAWHVTLLWVGRFIQLRSQVMGFKRPQYKTVPAMPGHSVFLCVGDNEALFMQGEPTLGLVSISAMGRNHDGLCKIVDFLNDPAQQGKLSQIKSGPVVSELMKTSAHYMSEIQKATMRGQI